MIRKTRLKNASILCSLALILSQNTTFACGPFFDEANFIFNTHPDFPLAKYISGTSDSLGIIQPSFARSYLAVAYRCLNNSPLNPVEQKSILNLWNMRIGNSGSDEPEIQTNSAIDTWNITRKKFSANTKDVNIWQYKDFSKTDPANNTVWFNYINCPNDAFDFASKTANTVANKFGTNSLELKTWITDQDKVFCNCGGNSEKISLPSPLSAEIKKDYKPYYNYQIAAANFYAGNFDKANELFKEISNDHNSPFKNIAKLLILRSRIRKANIAVQNDETELKKIAIEIKDLISKKDKDLQAWHIDLNELLNFIEFKTNPVEMFQSIATNFSQGKYNSESGQALGDYTLLFDKFIGEDSELTFSELERKDMYTKASQTIKSNDLSDWILCIQAGDSFQHSYLKWKETGKVTWLLAALLSSNIKETAKLNELIQAAHKIDKNSPAYLSINYALNKILISCQRTKEAKENLDKIINEIKNKNTISPSTKNLFLEQRMLLASNLNEFIDLALQHPASIDCGWSCSEIPIDLSKINKSNNYPNRPLAFNSDSAEFLNISVPLSSLTQVLLTKDLPSKLKQDITQSLFVRAWLLSDEAQIKILAPYLTKNISTTSKLVSDFLVAKSTDEKQFTAAYLILKNPGMRPYITWGYGRQTPLNKIDDYQDNWWGESSLTLKTDSSAKNYLNCLSLQDQNFGKSENTKLVKLGPATSILAQSILPYAKTHLQDPRVPEALHLAVRAGKFADKNNNSTKFSKECFTLLHTKLPQNSWTKQTPYWY